MDGLITSTGEDKIKRFLRTLTRQEKIELIEEVRKMTKFKTFELEKSDEHGLDIEYNLMDGYYY